MSSLLIFKLRIPQGLRICLNPHSPPKIKPRHIFLLIKKSLKIEVYRKERIYSFFSKSGPGRSVIKLLNNENVFSQATHTPRTK
jgi:hypothetical protein